MDFGRVLTAMITPMHGDGSINFPEAQRIAEHLLDNGSDGLVVAGTTGEGATMDKDEKLKLFATILEITKAKKAKLIAGSSSNDTAATIELSKKAEALGVDGILAVVPYYNKPPQDSLYAHFSAVAQAVSLPIMLYNVPSRTSSNLEPTTVALLAKIGNIVALKESSGDMSQMSLLRILTPPDFMIYSGDDGDTLPMLSLGACGVVSVAGHLIGNLIHDMIIAWEKGDTAQALELHQRCYPIFKGIFMTTSPMPVKYSLQRLGFETGRCRLPLTWLNDAQAAEMDGLLREAGLI